MELLEAIFTRRSIRKFTAEPVSADDLHTLLRAACYAPTAADRRSWNFLVIQNPETLAGIAAAHEHAKMAAEANLVIIVCGDNQIQPRLGFVIEDCAAALQNILLAAHGLGLGAVWCGLYPDPGRVEEISQRFALPSHIIPVGLIAIGHPAETRTTEERYDPAKMHFEQW